MRELTGTLAAAQKAASRVPYVNLKAAARISGVVRLDWDRLYTGGEDDYFHALTMPGDGSLVRTRITLPGDSRKLYRQRVSDPGPESDFSSWIYTGQYNCVVVAAASQGAEVSIFWINSSRQIRRIKSTDNGASWGSPELIDYSPTTAINGLAAAYKPSGDLAVFFADGSTLYVKKHAGGGWQSKTAWDKSTGELSGVAVVYGSDWDLLVTGQDADGNYRLWSVVYGDGGEVSSGSWSTLKELASAPSGGDYQYASPFLDRPDTFRCFQVEQFAGSQSYNRPFWSHAVPDTGFTEGLWHEPVPFNLSSEYGLAIAHHGDYCWMSNPAGVWRAVLAEQSLDLTADIILLRQEAGPWNGSLTAELRNDQSQYASPGTGSLSVLSPGAELRLGLGCTTPEGNEIISGLSFLLEAFEHTSRGGDARLRLHAQDAWQVVGRWRARHQFRWNKDSDEMSVRDILAFVLSRVGIKLEAKSQSSVMTGYYPDFTIHPGNDGIGVVRRLLSFVPDVLFVEGGKAFVINPLSTDNPVYSYGNEHVVLEGAYWRGAWQMNRVQVEGYDPAAEEPIIVDSFEWDQITRFHDRLLQVEDRNLGSVAEAGDRGEAYLREAEMKSAAGAIRVPVNCGQQLYDVVDITDARAGLESERMRVVGIDLVYHPSRGDYEQRLSLGAA